MIIWILMCAFFGSLLLAWIKKTFFKIEIIPNQFVFISPNISPLLLTPFDIIDRGCDKVHSRSVILTMRRTNEPKPTIINIFWRLFIIKFNKIISIIVVTQII